MAKSIAKADLMWLIYNTEIDNICLSVDECRKQDVVFRLYRPHHIKKICQIFSDCNIIEMTDKDNNKYAKIKKFTIYDLYRSMSEKGGGVFLSTTDNRIYYSPIDKIKNRHIFNRVSAKMLANLPSDKKVNILRSLSQNYYITSQGQEKSEKALEKKTDKILALLQIRIPPQFIKDELHKVSLIAAEIAKIPNIKENIEKFPKLTLKNQQDLLRMVCEITAKYNNIDVPNIKFLTQKQIDEDEGLDKWVSAEAFSYEKNVVINKDFFKRIDGAQALSLAWHETTHIAQAYGDYSQYPLVEELFNHHLNFLQKMPQTYIFHPQEKVVYALEKQFIEEIVGNTGIKTNDTTFSYAPEYDIATQYIYRSTRIKS